MLISSSSLAVTRRFRLSPSSSCLTSFPPPICLPHFHSNGYTQRIFITTTTTGWNSSINCNEIYSTDSRDGGCPSSSSFQDKSLLSHSFPSSSSSSYKSRFFRLSHTNGKVMCTAVRNNQHYSNFNSNRCHSSATASTIDPDKNSYKDNQIDNDLIYPPPTDDYLKQKGLPLLVRAAHFAQTNRTLLYDTYHPSSSSPNKEQKITYSYGDVLKLSTYIHQYIISKTSIPSSKSIDAKKRRKIAFLCKPGSSYVAIQWSCWSSGSIAVPLCVSHTSREFTYVLKDCDAEFVISAMDDDDNDEVQEELLKALNGLNYMDRLVLYKDILIETKEHEQQQQDDESKQEQQQHYELGADSTLLPSLDTPAMILYTSGTTGNPKGVVSTHRNIYHQITDLVLSWKWNKEDSILHFLPLHHVHGVINKLCCAIWVGASVEFMKFHPIELWKRLAAAQQKQNDNNGNGSNKNNSYRRPITLFMAVPTVYAKLLETIPSLPSSTISDALSSTLHPSNMRLMVSGSAALPTSILSKWEDVTKHRILERYGMTEFAMALSNPYHPIEERHPGYVGLPLPSVDVKIVDEDTGDTIIPDTLTKTISSSPATTTGTTETLSGELCVKGPTVFIEYYNKPSATASAFDDDGYFRTGDVAEYDPQYNSYQILGRLSADIIKCGGHKLSGLHIERVLLEHPMLEEAVVLGVPDETYGERVGLICRLKTNKRVDDDDDYNQGNLTLNELHEWCLPRMAKYKIPTLLKVMENDIPKNAMGKVSKKQLVHLFIGE
mmetsp:Transcript_18235/g.26111  ORF Transcript_18235/g.26111 Transcript_18235/m.26111 type:complete len:775 (-) Transcript_18235:1889-4213(-)